MFITVESQKLLSRWKRMQQPLADEADGETGENENGAANRAGRRKREQIAMVVDEYGSFVGIVTVEDMVETMLGLEIVDEKDTITDMQQYARERWTSSKAYRRINE